MINTIDTDIEKNSQIYRDMLIDYYILKQISQCQLSRLFDRNAHNEAIQEFGSKEAT